MGTTGSQPQQQLAVNSERNRSRPSEPSGSAQRQPSAPAQLSQQAESSSSSHQRQPAGSPSFYRRAQGGEFSSPTRNSNPQSPIRQTSPRESSRSLRRGTPPPVTEAADGQTIVMEMARSEKMEKTRKVPDGARARPRNVAQASPAGSSAATGGPPPREDADDVDASGRRR